jgi:hypothetical protein
VYFRANQFNIGIISGGISSMPRCASLPYVPIRLHLSVLIETDFAQAYFTYIKLICSKRCFLQPAAGKSNTITRMAKHKSIESAVTKLLKNGNFCD